jgi:hypothetical protein
MASELPLHIAMGFLFEKLEVYHRAVGWGEEIESLFGAKVGWAVNDLESRLQQYWAGLLKTGGREGRGSPKNKSVPVFFT